MSNARKLTPKLGLVLAGLAFSPLRADGQIKFTVSGTADTIVDVGLVTVKPEGDNSTDVALWTGGPRADAVLTYKTEGRYPGSPRFPGLVGGKTYVMKMKYEKSCKVHFFVKNNQGIVKFLLEGDDKGVVKVNKGSVTVLTGKNPCTFNADGSITAKGLALP